MLILGPCHPGRVSGLDIGVPAWLGLRHRNHGGEGTSGVGPCLVPCSCQRPRENPKRRSTAERPLQERGPLSISDAQRSGCQRITPSPLPPTPCPPHRGSPWHTSLHGGPQNSFSCRENMQLLELWFGQVPLLSAPPRGKGQESGTENWMLSAHCSLGPWSQPALQRLLHLLLLAPGSYRS